MSKISIEASQASDFYGAGFVHLYLVYEDNNGTEYVIRGGPQNPFPPYNGPIIISNNVLLENSADRRVNGNGDPLTPQDRFSTSIDLNGRDAEDVWQVLIDHADNIHNEILNYILPSQNSNSVIASLLNVIGIDISDSLPSGISAYEVLGMGNLLAFDYVLQGGGEADIIQGFNGNDAIRGEDENDTIFGGDGNDNLLGNDGDDHVAGEAGNDTIQGESGSDRLGGGDGNDIILGGADDDELYGGGGDDSLNGGADNDSIYFHMNFGNDTVTAGETLVVGTSTLSGDFEETGANTDIFRKGGIMIETDANGDGSFDQFIVKVGGNSINVTDWAADGDYGINLVYDEDSEENGGNEPPRDDNTPSQIDEAADLFGRAQVNQFTDPLVLDLDGDGIELLNLDESNVYFDMTGDGYAEHVGWVAPDDGLLVRAAANDNEITNKPRKVA